MIFCFFAVFPRTFRIVSPKKNNPNKEVIVLDLQLTQKEQTLLNDQLKHEEICIKKYTYYSEQAADPELKQLFLTLASQEKEHYSTIDQMLKGQQPDVTQSKRQGVQGQIQGQSSPATQMGYEQANMGNTTGSQADATLCTDMLMTEKFISGSYDSGIFQSTTPPVTMALQHIQKEEQEHGQKIQAYMQKKGLH